MAKAMRGGAIDRMGEREDADDPYMLTFDKGVAFLSYGLLFISPFAIGVPAVVSLAIAIAHRADRHPITRSHYRYQSSIFWTSAILIAVGLGAFFAGGGVALTELFGWAQSQITGVHLPAWMTTAYGDTGERDQGDLLMEVGVVLALSGALWLMLGSLWGAFKLVLGRPIGKTR